MLVRFISCRSSFCSNCALTPLLEFLKWFLFGCSTLICSREFAQLSCHLSFSSLCLRMCVPATERWSSTWPTPTAGGSADLRAPVVRWQRRLRTRPSMAEPACPPLPPIVQLQRPPHAAPRHLCSVDPQRRRSATVVPATSIQTPGRHSLGDRSSV